MKPIVIIKETNKNGKFEFTEEELKGLIEQAYEQGVADEKKNHNLNWITTTPGTIQGTTPGIGTANPAFPNDRFVHRSELNQTSGQPNPMVKLNGFSASTGV